MRDGCDTGGGGYAVTSTLVPSVELLDLVELLALSELVEEDVAPFAPVAVLLEAELLELLAAEALAVVAAFSNAAISASTTATCEATSCASVALAVVFEASSVANSFSRVASCFCKEAICAVLLLELLDPTAETMMLSPDSGPTRCPPLIDVTAGCHDAVGQGAVKIGKDSWPTAPWCALRGPT
jgi:hypothetical protein